MATANPRSPRAVLDVPFPDPWSDDGQDNEEPRIDDEGHMHFTSTSKGFRSALAQGKADIHFPCGLAIGGEVPRDRYRGSQDLTLTGPRRTANWQRIVGYNGPGLTARDTMLWLELDGIDLALHGGAELIKLERLFLSNVKRLTAVDAADAGAIFGGVECQGLNLEACKFLHARCVVKETSQFESRGSFYERGKNGLPTLDVTAGTLVSGPIGSVNDHFERDDLGPAFRFKGFHGGVVERAFLVYSVGVFEECSHIDASRGNVFKYEARFDTSKSPQMDATRFVTTRTWWGGWATVPVQDFNYVDTNP